MQRFRHLGLQKITNSIASKASLLSSSQSSSSSSSSQLFLPLITSFREIHPTLLYHSPADVSQTLADEIKRIIEHDKLVLFLTGTPEAPQCKFTSSLIDLMDQLEVEYGYFDIAADDEMCEAVKAYSD